MRLIKWLRWRLFTRDERLVIRQALNGNLPYAGGGQKPYGMRYADGVDVLIQLREEMS